MLDRMLKEVTWKTEYEFKNSPFFVLSSYQPTEEEIIILDYKEIVPTEEPHESGEGGTFVLLSMLAFFMILAIILIKFQQHD